METLVFDIEGSYAMFRKPFTPLSPVSYPFPPPPTVMGMIGAICGYEKDAYLDRIGWNSVRIGVALRRPVQRFRAGINLVNTKIDKYFRLTGANPRIQIPHEFIKDPAYRIYVGAGEPAAMDDLGKRLRDGTNVFTVSLGLAQCLATVTFVDVVEARPLRDGQHEVSTVVPKEQSKNIRYEPGKRYGVFRIPARMNPNRVVTQYGEVVVDEEGGRVAVETSSAFDAKGENVFFF